MKAILRNVLIVLLATGSISAKALGSKTPEAKQKPLTLIVPFSQGGPTDNLARPVAKAMSHALGLHVVVKNIVGAGGTLGALQAAKAKPDGSTLLFANVGHAVAPSLFPKLKYDPVKDFEPIGLVADVPMVLVGRRTLKAGTFEELRELIQKQARKLILGHAGNGSASHLCGLMLMRALKRDFEPRSYPGTADAMADLVTEGNIDLLCDQTTSALDEIQGKTVRAYGVTAASRLEKLANVPTLAEAGLPGFELMVWHGMYAPKGTPQPVLEKLTAALRTALQDAELQKELSALGARPVSLDKVDAQALRLHLEAEIKRWQKIVGVSEESK